MQESEEVRKLKQEVLELHRDCQDLAKFIVAARNEIAELKPADLKYQRLPRAGKELDAIVEATENATNQIMSATETIMSSLVTEADVVNNACMQIFEACSFQDITGQRISKVVKTLNYIEENLTRLTRAWGQKVEQYAPSTEGIEEEQENDENGLLNGPALAGEGVDQQYIDNIFDEEQAEKKEKTAEAAGKKSSQSDAQDAIDALFD
ncbi:MAG: chemotaxis protein CheZ [Alphaproteobacteria bacterium]|nr:MAG: chemotaxis protein CheZ [Alphaproteobacteria bacterium]